MAIITAPEPRQGFGGQVGSSLGEALQYLAQNRLAKMQRQQQAEELSPSLQALIPGLNPQQALGLGLMDPSVQREIIKQKLVEPGNIKNAEYLENFLAKLSGQTPQAQIPTEEGQISDTTGIQPTTQKPLTGISSKDLTKDIELALKAKSLGVRQEIAEKKLQQQKNLAYAKESAAWRSKIRNEYGSNLEMEPIIERMKEVEQEAKEKGGLTDPLTLLLGEFAGIKHPEMLMNPESEEFTKLRAFFQKFLRDQFGGRPTDQQLNAYMSQFPSLFNSPEGRQRLFKDLQFGIELSKIKNDTISDLEEKSSEKWPQNFQSIALKQIAKKEKKLYSQIYKKTKKESWYNTKEEAIEAAKQQGKTSIIDDKGKIIQI